MLNSRNLLLAGFGGVLALMLFAGIDAARLIGAVQVREQRIRREYLTRNRLLNAIRSDLYISGTYVRDYLLEPNVRNADLHLVELGTARRRMEVALAQYERILKPTETKPFSGLRQEITGYWRMLDPIFRWTPDQRKAGGYQFLRDEVFPRRMAMLDVADQIANINESSLLAGEQSVESLFSEFRQRLLISLLITMAVGIALAGFSMQRILRLEHETEARRGELTALSAELVAAQEDERRSISRELHDEVSQSLSAVLVELGNLAADLPPAAVQSVQKHIDTIRALVGSSVDEVRNISLLLRPSMLDDLGLVPALEWQARETSRRTGLRVSVVADDVSEDLPEDHKTCIYRVVQEALHNCARHSGARKVKVTVLQQDHVLRLAVEDDGKGFDTTRAKGLGLLGMEERVARLKGNFRVQSRPGEGTSISVMLPLSVSGGPHDQRPVGG
jgi:signal transduction histidine kinase